MAILFAQIKAREFHLDQILILIDSLEVIHAIEEKEDWILRIHACGGHFG